MELRQFFVCAVYTLLLVAVSFSGGYFWCGGTEQNCTVVSYYMPDQTVRCSACEDCRYCRDLQEAVDRLVLYGKPVNISLRTNGVWYNTSQYFCVWTANRTETSINKTIIHEECHRLVDSDPNHFCEQWITQKKREVV